MDKKSVWLNKTLVIGILILFIGMSVIPPTGGIGEDQNSLIDNKIKTTSEETTPINNDTEYWAIIFAVGIYYKHPEYNIPSMLACADDLYNVLVDSPNWQADHIHKVTANEATGRRLIRELLWLIINEDSDDMSLIYLTTHGGPLLGPGGNPIDLPPKDEDDGADEVLTMYHGFDKWYAFISDDLLSFFLSLLQSKGVCLIVDSCHAGGFNDEPMFAGTTFKEYTAKSFTQGFTEELASQGRVVLMSCSEDEEEYGLVFSEFLIDGFWGQADIEGNKDGINSAEEAFDYAESRVKDQHPTILDLYPGEYPVTFT